jgi:hypothetical protein
MPPVPKAGSDTVSPGFGAMTSTMAWISARGVKDWPTPDFGDVAHPIVAQGEPGFQASTCVLACRRTGEAPSEPWAVAVVPELLDEGGGVHRDRSSVLRPTV